VVSDAATESTREVECPHCKKPFEAPLIAGGVERHRGFKCPHCKLFVPESRADDTPLHRDRG
jgi:DNA-directed RNA polymerase subunit RPC12/RpoP